MLALVWAPSRRCRIREQASLSGNDGHELSALKSIDDGGLGCVVLRHEQADFAFSFRAQSDG